MSDRQRHRAFAFAVLVTVAVCCLVWRFERPQPGDGAQAAPANGTTPSRRPIVLGGKASPAPTAEGTRPPTQAPSPSGPILATARRFTLAFLRYEVDSIPAGVRRTMDATATHRFATSLLSEPPRLPPGMPSLPREHLRSLTLAGEPKDGQATVRVQLRGSDGQVSSFDEQLARAGREWRVRNLG
jgi:hypothetical protein